ncbi:helix-turn-helix transcriptional regulator [Paenibacillus agricola]|uniref:Helix-turn-helix transcriptional regulator n=1 Tax=Paenibacillus agricola TaxID=2716264 RepID=A0ABX0JIM9_9BACL|nr:helix-turn-helix transcriptional regulator [Paenibacillus agricola]NHN33645.1 helix-turn-helix transcriptional regulator [Paenibacillus agricola]
MSELHNRVRELRARDRLSQADLAQLIGASRQTIALIERGDYAPSIVLALRIASVFQVQVEAIFSLERDEVNHEK